MADLLEAAPLAEVHDGELPREGDEYGKRDDTRASIAQKDHAHQSARGVRALRARARSVDAVSVARQRRPASASAPDQRASSTRLPGEGANGLALWRAAGVRAARGAVNLVRSIGKAQRGW